MIPDDFIRPIFIGGERVNILHLETLEKKGVGCLQHLPFSIKILVENLARHLDGRVVTEADLSAVANWRRHYSTPIEIPHHPERVLMQDFTGVPAVVDLAAMRDALKALGGDPAAINPTVPVELIVDHSVQVDFYGTRHALQQNVETEYQRNSERYRLLKWAQKSFTNFKVVPPNSGICHQVNLEHLGRVVTTQSTRSGLTAYPDTLVGTDSHTTMINSLGVMGWGVGGIEAEAVMLGQPYSMSIPEVVGLRLKGRLAPGVTATDLVLTITEMLRRHNVVEKFVEFFGEGMQRLSLPDRATIANMAPEYGATMGFFPVDAQTLAYLNMTHRSRSAAVVEHYTKENGLFYDGAVEPAYSEILTLDLARVEPTLAGPSRPQDRMPVRKLAAFWRGAAGARSSTKGRRVTVGGRTGRIEDGSVVIAAITSCTNTSNPHAMIGAGLVAQKAVAHGLTTPPTVKTSLAPGSRVVVDYLNKAGLMPYLEALGFHLAAFGCTTCIGNSGPLHPEIEAAIAENDFHVAAVLSGNRNFEARIHQSIKDNFLTSPMLVVVYALAGHIGVDVSRDPVGRDPNGQPVYLKDIWPAAEEIDALVKRHVQPADFASTYAAVYEGDAFWQALDVKESTTFPWDPESTYIRRPPYFDGLQPQADGLQDIKDAHVLLLLGDTVTTDHISPAGAIPPAYPAGRYLERHGVAPEAFNSYGARRGNHEVMMRGTFGNIRIRNRLVAPVEGGYTLKFPEKEKRFVFDAALAYLGEGRPLMVLAGTEYGTGSSRDWAAKGTYLLGVKAVIARSFERIHRSNLVGMGVLPLEFQSGESADALGLDGAERIFVEGIENLTPRKVLPVRAVKEGGTSISFAVTARIDTAVEAAYIQNGGILPYVLRKLIPR